MIKSELMLRIAEKNPHVYAKDVEKGVNAILDEIAAALVRRDRVELRGFGPFTVKTWPARPGRNPKTGESINIPETRHPSLLYLATGAGSEAQTVSRISRAQDGHL
jgi:integration host factor subunit beta